METHAMGIFSGSLMICKFRVDSCLGRPHKKGSARALALGARWTFSGEQPRTTPCLIIFAYSPFPYLIELAKVLETLRWLMRRYPGLGPFWPPFRRFGRSLWSAHAFDTGYRFREKVVEHVCELDVPEQQKSRAMHKNTMSGVEGSSAS